MVSGSGMWKRGTGVRVPGAGQGRHTAVAAERENATARRCPTFFVDNVGCQSSLSRVALGVLRGPLAPRVIGPPYTRAALALPVIGLATAPRPLRVIGRVACTPHDDAQTQHACPMVERASPPGWWVIVPSWVG